MPVNFLIPKKISFCLLLLCAFPFLSAQINIVKGPYLQIGTDNSMVIRWETDVSCDSKVEYGTSASSLTFFTGNLISDTVHEVQLSGLSPYTKYYYNIGTKTMVLQGDTNNYFVTSPLPGQEGKYRFWVTGDCGNLSTNQVNCKVQYNLYNGNRLTDGWLTLGDNAYFNGTDSEFTNEFFAVYQTDIMKHAVLWPAPGNHDYNNGATTTPTVPYYDIFTLPTAAEAGGFSSGTEAYYSYDYGNVHFISLDSYGSASAKRMYDTTGAQSLWLKQDLAANNKRWTIAYFHHPPYTMGSHNSDTEVALDSIRSYFIALLERYQVDLVLCGHSHDYERSKLMKGHFGYEASFSPAIHNLDTSTALFDGSTNSCPYIKDSLNKKNGTVYVVSGSAGQLGGTQTSFPHAAMYYSDASNGGSFILDIEANRLDAKWLCADGVIRDRFTMLKNVNKVSTFTVAPSQTLALNASWPGNYLWSNGDTTRTTVVSPTTNIVYWVKDKLSCVADTFKVSISTGVNALSLNKDKTLSVYPNPTKDNFTLELVLGSASDVSIKVSSASGQILKVYEDKKYPAGINKILLSSADLKLANGVYIISAVVNGISFAERVVISK